jgi:hypothetical protein
VIDADWTAFTRGRHLWCRKAVQHRTASFLAQQLTVLQVINR